MTTVNKQGINQLELYFSNSLLGDYELHSNSPVVVGNKFGRNAGSLFDYNNKLYRVAQDCELRYGDDVHLFEIKDMNKENYSEYLCKKNLLAGKSKFYSHGGHQFSWVRFKNQYIVATDAKEYHYLILNKIAHRLKIY